MDALEDLDDPHVSMTRACQALGASRATLYRRMAPPVPPSGKPRPPSHRRLPEAERQRILQVLYSDEFIDQPPREVYATLLSRGLYLASIRTMYRILQAARQTKERRIQRRAHPNAVPRLAATAPNQVWTWDITKLATTMPGRFLCLYVILDLFSRYVVGWMVAERECRHLAARLFRETIARHDVVPGEMVVHSDRGSPMKSDTLAKLFAAHGVERSLSRPRVSNDNPFSEAHFKTLKYQPDYPGRFMGVLDARGWLRPYFSWHNHEHHHVGLALYTPADVFNGRVDTIVAKRQGALDAAYAANPERFVNGAPQVPRPPEVVAINPLTIPALELEVGSSSPDLKLSIAPAATSHTGDSLIRGDAQPHHQTSESFAT